MEKPPTFVKLAFDRQISTLCRILFLNPYWHFAVNLSLYFCSHSNCDHYGTGMSPRSCFIIFLEPHKGACVPISCDDKGQCPPQGIPISGVLNGQCKEDEKTCDYGMGIAILIA